MDSFANQPDKERKELLQETASRRDSTDIIIEKDFWVCWTLKRLFTNPALAPYLIFKGGTSLSKAYGLIERFSEDIDLTINRNAPFLKDGKDPMEEGISKKERGRRLEALKVNAQAFVNKIILPTLRDDIVKLLGKSDSRKVVLDAEDPDQQTILFYYPKVFGYDLGYGQGKYGVGPYGEAEKGYIQPQIKLEFGARGEINPNESRKITPFVAETFPEQFENPSQEVAVLSAERTFWEKATILHALYHNSKLKDRMSRHYYDTFMLSQGGVAEKAIQKPELLERVVRNKHLLFRDASASYGAAVIGSLKLVPTADQQATLKKDYDKMEEMFMGEYPDFAAVMTGLADLENKINNSG